MSLKRRKTGIIIKSGVSKSLLNDDDLPSEEIHELKTDIDDGEKHRILAQNKLSKKKSSTSRTSSLVPSKLSNIGVTAITTDDQIGSETIQVKRKYQHFTKEENIELGKKRKYFRDVIDKHEMIFEESS